MAIKTNIQIIESMLSFFSRKRPTIPVGVGDPVRDVVIEAPSREISDLYDSIDNASQETSLRDASIIGLDVLGGNVGVVRKTAVKSTGIITFFSRNPINSDIFIPANTVISTSSSGNSTLVQFSTVASVTMFADSSSIYLNTETGVYEISIGVRALIAGVSGNVGANTVTSLSSSVSGIDGCYNSGEIAGGVDAENLEILRSRIAEKFVSSGAGTSAGYLALVKSIEGVIDASFVGHGETGRDVWGAVDIYIKGSTPRSFTDVVTSIGANIPNIVLFKQPVLEDQTVSIRSSNSGSLASSEWVIEKDTGNYGGSIYAQDMIQWPSGSIPLSYGSLIIDYYYNGLVEDVQNLFVQTDKDVQNTNVLVKAARNIEIDLTAYVKILPGFSFTTVVSLIQENIISFFASQAIGAELQQADILRIILNVAGVDDVRIPFTTFQSSDGSITVNSNNNLTIPANGTVTLGTITLYQMF